MSSRGFTLIEVTIALVVGGMAVTAAAALLGGLGDRADAIRAAGERTDRDANAERLLRMLWGNLRFSGDSTRTVSGDSMAVSFASWCETVEGWLRPCRARLAVERENGEQAYRFRLELGSASPDMTFWSVGGPASIRYLRNAEHGGTWSTAWSEIVAPPAIAVIRGADTVIVTTW